MKSPRSRLFSCLILAGLASLMAPSQGQAQNFRPQKPVLHGKHWVAITGKPMAATAGRLCLSRVETPLMPPAQCWGRRLPCGTFSVGVGRLRL